MQYRSKYVISGGDGDDVITLDTTSAFHDVFGLDVTIHEDADGGYDRLHLTGSLAAKYIYNGEDILGDVPYAERIYKTGDGLHLYAQSVVWLLPDLSIDIVEEILNTVALRQGIDIHFGDGLDAVTDRLENKRTVNLGNVSTVDFLAQDFTDYVVSRILDPTVDITVNLVAAVRGIASSGPMQTTTVVFRTSTGRFPMVPVTPLMFPFW